MKKIIVCLILLFIIILVFKNKIELFKNYPDVSMKDHDEWISNTINYISIERKHIIQCVNEIKKELENTHIILNDSDNELVATIKFILNILSNVYVRLKSDPKKKKILDFLIEYLVNILSEYSDCDIYSILDINSTLKCKELISTIEKNTYNKTTGNIDTIKIPSFIKLLNHYLVKKDIEGVSQVILNIFEEKYIKQLDQYNNNISKLPCLIYDKNNCPNDRCSFSTIENICHPKYDGNTPSNASANVNSCGILSQYGKKYCESTKDNNNIYCKYDDKRNKCVSLSDSNKSLECNEVGGNTPDDFKNNCQSLKNEDNTSKCTYKKITKKDKTYNYCYDKNADNRPSNICLSFSNTDKNQIPNELNCKINEINKDLFYSLPPNIENYELSNLCHLFDNSDTMSDNTLKNSDDKINIDSIELQKELCNNNSNCKFVEHNTYVSNINNDQKYRSKFTKCLPKDTDIDASYIDNRNIELKKTECLANPNNIWSDVNKMCIDKTNKCNDTKYEKLCNYKADCHWTSIGIHNPDSNDNFERGYCNKINTENIEKIIDIVHQKEINNLIKVKELEDTVNKFNQQIYSQNFLDKVTK